MRKNCLGHFENKKKYKKLLRELNKLLSKYSISDPIRLEEFSIDHMIRLYEALYDTEFPFTNKKNDSKKTQIKYLKFLLGTISHESLRIDLSYIDPVLVIKHDIKSIMNIVEVLVIIGHLQRLKEKITTRQEVNVEKESEEGSDSFVSDEILKCEEEADYLENNEASICSSLKDSQDIVHTPNSLVSSESVSVMSYFTNRANKVFNRIRSLNLDATQPTCVNEASKKNLVENKNIKDERKQAVIKNTNLCGKNKIDKISKHCRSIGTQTLLPYFSETPNSQISPLSSSPNASYQCSSKIRTCSIKKMMQKVSLNTWESQSSEDESLESDLFRKENIKTSINKKIEDIADFQSNFQQESLKRNDYYDQTLKDKIKIMPNNGENAHYHLLHTSHKVTPLRFRQNISQESSPNSDTTNIEFFKQKFRNGILGTDSPYTLYLRKRRKNALNALYAQRSHLEQNLKLSIKENRKIPAKHSKIKAKNIPYQKLYNRPLSDISFYSPSELKSQTSFFSNYENSITGLEKQLLSTKKLYF
ncbi:hypothetical protein PNEG_01619 [Pneumocystis murina B123]|uniref:DUF5745 domain-containing protein n=1 Tax=Pneumocystis murina (strain B123) TaxID=1069680 RepID=M7NSW4_PNEMU|nr:hypothetical protein PNEG_01619 [Pneumocystis murina B123]EMR10367.1 hypothetical protein PNEG_01619 [Pneumocystis murina B123]